MADPDPFLECVPCPGPITQEFGDMFSGYAHRGRDYGVPVGTPVVPGAPGLVVTFTNSWTTWNGQQVRSFGDALCIDFGNGLYGLYAHLSSTCVGIGDQVTARQIIGLSGNTGVSTGPHLHQQLCVNTQFPTDISYSRNPMDYLISEEEMEAIKKLEAGLARAERLLGGNAVNIECYPGWEDLVGMAGGFPVGTVPCQLQDDGWKAAPGSPTYTLTGNPALEACDRRGFSFPLGLRSTQIAQNRHQSDGHGG